MPERPSSAMISRSSSFLVKGSASFEREYARWMGRIESHAVIPLKLGMLWLTLLYWMWIRDWAPPSVPVFGVFFLFGAFTTAQAWLFWRDRISTPQVRPLVYLSYVIDLAFITALVWLDRANPPDLPMAMGAGGSDFYLLYLLLILRGFALFRTTAENLFVALLVSVLFVASMLWSPGGSDLEARVALTRLALVWGVMLLATFIVNIVSKQQEEVLRVRERLVRAEGLASLGELAAGVAHEINNPIGIIKTYAEFLKRAAAPDSPHLDDYATIQKEAERCEAIVRRMLDFANPNVREMAPADIAAIVREVTAFVYHNKSGDKVKATVEIEDRIPPVYCDHIQIRQAMLNILVNARQILSGMENHSGQVDVRVRHLPGPRAPVQITIHDNGPGISPEDAERAFEPFFTRRSGGTGLGLAITRRIIESHAGTIEIWPAANGGTTCAITLPMAEEGA